MNLPINEDCELDFLHFKDEDARYLNKVFWRTGSFLLGYVLSKTFKELIIPSLHSWIPTDVAHSLFAYDFYLPYDWTPTQVELRILSKQLNQLCWSQLTIEPLLVDKNFALEMFENSKFKKEQIEKIASEDSSSGRTIKIYRVGKHVDISSGPMVANTRLFGRFDIVNIHKLPESCGENMFRAQAVALPSQLSLHQWTWNLLKKKATQPFYEYLPPKLEELPEYKRVSLPDPPLVKPSNLGWKTMHVSSESMINELTRLDGWSQSKKQNEYINSALNPQRPSYTRDTMNIVKGELAHDTRLRFNRIRYKWDHAPVFWKKSKPSIHVGHIRNQPKEFIKIPKIRANI